MDDQLLPWLRAQIAETVRIAQTVQAKEAPSPWLRRGQRLVRYNNGGDEGYEAVSVRHHGGAWERIRVMRDLDGTVADHIVRHDPRAVLAQCEAHTALVFWHERIWVEPGSKYFNDAHLTREPMAICRSCEPETMFRRANSWPCRTIKAVALAYQHNPGYQEAWRP